jgi:hypothetical protein
VLSASDGVDLRSPAPQSATVSPTQLEDVVPGSAASSLEAGSTFVPSSSSPVTTLVSSSVKMLGGIYTNSLRCRVGFWIPPSLVVLPPSGFFVTEPPKIIPYYRLSLST